MNTTFIKKGISVLFAIFSFVVALHAQDVNIRGVVCNSEQIPLYGVSVADLSNQGNGTLTNQNGYYKLNLTQLADSTLIEFRSMGFYPLKVMIPALEEDIELNISLEEQTQELNSVIINALPQNKRDYMQLDVYSKKSKSYFLNSSIESMVSMMPGVSSTNELSSQYQVRGGNFDENLVYINGVEVYRPLLMSSARQEGMSIINPDMVDAVAFSTGGYGAEYGDKTSSVLDIMYKRPKKFEAKVGASILDATAYVGNSTKKFSQMTNVRYKTTEWMLKSGDTKAEYKPSFVDAQTFMNYDFSPKIALSFWGNYSGNEYKFKPKTRSTKFGTLNNVREFNVNFSGKEEDKFQTGQGALNLTTKVNDKVTLNLIGSLVSSREEEAYDITGRYRLTDQTEEEEGGLLGVGTHHQHARNKLNTDIYRLEHKGKWNLNNNELKWGVAYSHERFKDRISEWEMRDSTGYPLPHNENDIDMYNNLKSKNDTKSNHISGYLQDRYLLNTNSGLFTFVGGVRVHYWDFNKDVFFSPRLYARFIPASNDKLSFHLSGGLYYQAPFYKEYQGIKQDINGNNTVYLNNDIKPQQSLHFILGNDISFRASQRNFRFSTELYYKHLSDIIPYTVNNLKIRYSGLNEGKGYIAGMDMRLYGELVKGTTSWLGFSLMKTEQKINGKKAPLPTDQRFMVTAYIEDYMPGYERLKLGFTGSVSGGLPISVPNKNLTDEYFRSKTYKRADIALSWQILGENFKIRKKNSFIGAFKNIWLGGEILNLFDVQNVSSYYWISDVYSNQFAVPNYHTGRKFNVRLVCEF